MFTLFVSLGVVTTKDVRVKVLRRQMPGPVPRAGDALILNRLDDSNLSEVVEIGQVQRIYGAATGVPGLHPTEIRAVAEGIKVETVAKVDEIAEVFIRKHGFVVDEETTASGQAGAEKTVKAARDAFASMKGIMESNCGEVVCADCAGASCSHGKTKLN